MAASLFQRRTDSVFLFSLQCPGIETMVETVRASRNASAELSFAPHHVGNGFIRSACYGFVGNSRSGYRNNRIGISVKAKIKSALAHTMIIHYSLFIIHYSLKLKIHCMNF